MALVEKSTSITMGQAGGSKMAIHCQGVQKSEIPAIREALDSTNVYKSMGYSVVSEESTFTDGTMALPAAITMTGKRDAQVQVKLRNTNKQNLFLGLECPVDTGDTSALDTWVQVFVGKTLTVFGAVAEASWVIKK